MTDNSFAPSPAPSDVPVEETDFGFRSVRKEEKKNLVRGVFDSVAGQYDVMNDIM
ncbi:MAG: class I SAM-dependent methyltransferase, partial [Acetobacter syzygii]